MSKTCNGCGTDDSFAMELLKSYSAQAKRWFVACMVILALWFATISWFVWYIDQYDFESYETTIEQDGEGINNYIGENGDIMNGAKNK